MAVILFAINCRVDVYAADDPKSGQCGPNVTWRYNGEGIVISGEGPMYDAGTRVDWNRPPWLNAYYCDNIRKLIIEEGVTYIGKNDFKELENLEEIYIPSTLTGIGDRIFYGDGSINKIVIAEGNKVYDNTPGLNAIIDMNKKEIVRGCSDSVIPDYVESIGDWAFTFAKGMDGFSIPEGITHIGSMAFFLAEGLNKIVVPDSVKSIGKGAFQSIKITSIVLPSGLTVIQDDFVGLHDDISIYIPRTVQKIGSNFYRPAGSTRNVNIVYEGSKDEWNKIKIDTFLNDSLLYYANIVYLNRNEYDGGNYVRKADVLVDKNTNFTYEALSKMITENNPCSELIHNIDDTKKVFMELWNNKMGVGLVTDPTSSTQYVYGRVELYMNAFIDIFENEDSEAFLDVYDKSLSETVKWEKKLTRKPDAIDKFYSAEKLALDDFDQEMFESTLIGTALYAVDSTLKPIKNIFKQVSNFQDGIEATKNAIMLAELHESYIEIFEEMYESAKKVDPYLGLAIKRSLDSVRGDTTWINELGTFLGVKSINFMHDKIWKMMKEAIFAVCPVLEVISKAVDLGWDFGNLVANTDKIISKIYDCAVVAEITSLVWYTLYDHIEKYQKESTTGNAMVLDGLYGMYEKILEKNYDSVISYLNPHAPITWHHHK